MPLPPAGPSDDGDPPATWEETACRAELDKIAREFLAWSHAYDSEIAPDFTALVTAIEQGIEELQEGMSGPL